VYDKLLKPRQSVLITLYFWLLMALNREKIKFDILLYLGNQLLY